MKVAETPVRERFAERFSNGSAAEDHAYGLRDRLRNRVREIGVF
jgi:hypothetical protein